MYKIVISLAMVTFLACNSKEPKVASESSSANAAKRPAAWSENDEMDFVYGCVESSKSKLGEDKAVLHCRCILKQVESENPENDSLKTSRILSDTARVAKMSKDCDPVK